MKKWGWIRFLLAIIALLPLADAAAQCALCTKTASQLGEKPAAALNSAIIYLMAAPFAIVGFIGWRWWKGQKEADAAEGEETAAETAATDTPAQEQQSE